MLRTPREAFWSLTERPGFPRLRLRPQRVAELANPSFVGRRQQHLAYSASAAMPLTPACALTCAGLALLQNNDYHIRFVVTMAAYKVVAQLLRRERGVDALLGQRPVAPGICALKVEARGQSYAFYIANEPEVWLPVAEHVDGRVLSTTVAGGFTGAYIGMYASSNGQPSSNAADFDWFEYLG